MIEGELCHEALEDLIFDNENVSTILRLLCLQSLTAGGIKSAKYDSLRREIIQTFGLEFLPLFNHLEKLGALKRREGIWVDSSSYFTKLRQLLVLVNADVSTIDPTDFTYVSSGYAPLTVRLVQAASQGWAGKENTLRELPRRLVDVLQTSSVPETFEEAFKRSQKVLRGAKLGKKIDEDAISEAKPLVIVYFVGGVTFTELAALRFLNQRPIFPFQIICCTTKVYNGTKLIKSLM